MDVMSAITERSNMLQAYQRVGRNKGAPGVDGVTTDALKGYLQTHWQHIKQQLLEGSYRPQPVRKVEIPKPGGGMRMLGIPCVQRLKLQVNREKSAADRPWKRSFLGYTVCSRNYNIRLKVADKSVKRLKGNIKALLRMAKGWSIRRTVNELAPKLRGWINYFHHADAKGIFNELDGWLRRHLRKILWRQWKRGLTRARMLMRLGIAEKRAVLSTTNGRGSWWNAGASHMNQALPKKLFDRLGLISLMDSYHQLKCNL
ncbi:group II intron maturase-specific domain-containing protein [Aliidiomarina maris]|nr:group II intron maturase-specific domain-containing protein [Aliidiomarina maris]RAJ98926.1 group II intron maturase [Aliidiomarina maris]